MKRKLMAALLALVMCLSLLPTVAWADEIVAKIGENEYTTLAEAVAEANTGDTITLLDDANGAGIFLGEGSKNITIDLNNHTYTCTGPAVGSTGTASQALHLEKGNAVAIKNGKITSTADSGVKMLVQNYCDLTLDEVTLDGTNLPGSNRYVMSNNYGDVNIKGNTSIKAGDGNFAFDSCGACWKNHPYGKGATVTVDTTGTIDGKIECCATIKIKNGTFNGDITLDSTNDENCPKSVTITGGTFSFDPTAYVATGYVATPTNNTFVVSTELAAAKTAAKAAIDTAVGGDTSENVAAAAKDAKTAIDAADGTDAVAAAKTAGEAAIAAAKAANKAAAELAAAKTAAKAAIDTAVGADTSENVAAAAKDAKTAIDAADNTAAVNTAKENGLAAIQSAKDKNSKSNPTDPTGPSSPNAGNETVTISADDIKTDGTTNTIDVASSGATNVTASKDVLDDVVKADATKPVEFVLNTNTAVEFNEKAVQAIAGKMGGDGDITLVVAPNATVTNDKEQTAMGTVAAGNANAQVVKLELKQGADNLFTGTAGAKATVTVPFAMPAGCNRVNVYYLNSGTGKADYVGTASTANGTAAFTVEHFSSYALVPTYVGGSSSSVPSGHTMTTNLSGITTVYVDGKKVDSKYYTISGGNVTLTQAYLNTLSAGKHTFKAENATHIATGTFNVAKGAVSPQTADAGIAIYGMMSIMSLMGMGYIGKKKSR